MMNYFLAKILTICLGVAYFVWRSLAHAKRGIMWNGPKLDPYAMSPPFLLPPGVIYKRLPVLGTSHVAVYYRCVDKFKPWLVYYHGIMSNCETNIELFDALGDEVNVVMWDYRGFGRSTGAADETVCLYDLQYLLAWLERAFDVEIERDVVLIGSSLGTNIVQSYLRDVRRKLP